MEIIDFLKNYFQTDKCFLAYITIFGILLIFLFYTNILKKRYGDKISKYDPMNKKLDLKVYPFDNISMWPVSHFVMYFILGFMFPYCARGILTIGIAWEIIECLIGNYKYDKNLETDPGKYQYSKNWWSGTVQDLFYNLSGFIFGAFISIYIFKKE